MGDFARGAWDHEPMHSDRSDDWIIQHRFPTLDAAKEAVAKKIGDDANE